MTTQSFIDRVRREIATDGHEEGQLQESARAADGTALRAAGRSTKLRRKSLGKQRWGNQIFKGRERPVRRESLWPAKAFMPPMTAPNPAPCARNEQAM
jgi:hypothetical protein